MNALTLGDIDRMMENALVKELHRIGWYPDKEQFVTDIVAASTPEQEQLIQDDFRAQKDALIANGKIANVFGVGNYKDRKELRENNIIIDRESISPSIGNFTQEAILFEEYEVIENGETLTKYKKSIAPITPEDIEYSVTIVCETSRSERVLTNMVLSFFGSRKRLVPYLENWVSIECLILVERLSVVNISGSDYIERVFRFVARDLVLSDATVLDESVPRIEEIDIGLNVSLDANVGLESEDEDVKYNLPL